MSVRMRFDLKQSPLHKLIVASPQPIVDSQHKIVLLWNAKAGCTFAVKWMLGHMGLLREALAASSLDSLLPHSKAIQKRGAQGISRGLCRRPRRLPGCEDRQESV